MDTRSDLPVGVVDILGLNSVQVLKSRTLLVDVSMVVKVLSKAEARYRSKSS